MVGEQSSTIGDVQAFITLSSGLIEDGDLKRAASVLSTAISHLVRSAVTPDPIVVNQEGRQEESSQPFLIYCYSELDPEERDLRSEFFSDPFLLESEEAFNCEDRPWFTTQHAFCTICCLFNLGLCFHLEWQRNRSKSLLLSKALQSYEIALSLTNTPGVTIRPNDPILKVLMSLCTNAMHCHDELGNPDQVWLLGRRLQDILDFSRVITVNSQRFFTAQVYFNSTRRVGARAA